MDKTQAPLEKAPTPAGKAARVDLPAKGAPILLTGSAGFLGRNLAARLTALGYTNLLLYDLASPKGALESYAQTAAFVFHLAGVNRPVEPGEFYTGNAGLTQTLLGLLEKNGNRAPFLLSSSAQAGNGSDYAKSKEQAEAAVFAHGRATGAAVYVYRLPGVFGKWSRPAYNSVVATFCHNIARGEAIEVREEQYSLPLCYVDDVVDSFLGALEGRAAPRVGEVLGIRPVYEVTLGDLAARLRRFHEARSSLQVPAMNEAFERKLYATYLSYLPPDAFAYALAPKEDQRGSFTEFLRSEGGGQVAVNVAKPGIVKGNHWHDTKNEKFLVVQGEAVIRFRRLFETEVQSYRVKGTELRPVDIPPGYTHNIENVGSGDLITLMWASEAFDPDHPDTYFEEV